MDQGCQPPAVRLSNDQATACLATGDSREQAPQPPVVGVDRKPQPAIRQASEGDAGRRA